MSPLYHTLAIEKNNSGCVVEVQFADVSHPVFQAHFPSNSLLPGFLQIDTISEILEVQVIEIKKAKFLQPILPEDKVIFNVIENENQFTVKTEKENKKCSEFTFVTKY